MKLKFPDIPKRTKILFILVLLALPIAVMSLLLKKKRVDISSEALRLSASIFPSGNAKSFSLQLGYRLAKAKQWDAAKKVFQEVLIIEPTNASILNNLAYIAGEQGDLPKATEYLETAVQIDGKCAECLNNLASLHYKRGKPEEARRLFERAANLDPAYLDPRLNVAILLEEQSDWLTAMEWYQQAEKLVTDPELKKWIGVRTVWMAEIGTEARRQIAGEKK